MLKVKSFLCFSLETGGLIIGYFSLTVYTICFLVSIVGMAIGAFIPCDKIMENPDVSCSGIRTVAIIVCGILALVTFAFAYIAWLLVKGTKTRDHTRVKPMMIVLGISFVLSMLNVLSLDLNGIIRAIVPSLISGYNFVAIYSLYDSFRN